MKEENTSIEPATPRRGRGRPSLRNQLIDIAREILRDEGAPALTARSLARRAGVAEATVFNNFGDFRGLLLAVSQEGHSEYDALLHCIETGPLSDITSWLEEVFTLTRLYMVATMPLAIHQLMSPTAALSKEPSRLVTSVHKSLSTRLLSLQQSGRLHKSSDVAAIAMLLIGTATHSALTTYTVGTLSLLSDDPTKLAQRVVASLGLVSYN